MILSNEAREAYDQALKDYRLAQQQESLADQDHIDIAIMQTNLAKEKFNQILKDIKAGVIT